MTPQQKMASGNWPIPQRTMATWDRPTVSPSPSQIPEWLQNLVAAYSQQGNPQNMANPQYQVQPQQNQPQPPTLIGRHIQDISEVKPIEIPMDGTATYFPTFDGSAIYLRYWDQDGQIKGVRYTPEVTSNEFAAMENSQIISFPTVQEINEAISPKIEDLSSRLTAMTNKIETLLAGGSVMVTQPTPRGGSRSKKEVTDNGESN